MKKLVVIVIIILVAMTCLYFLKRIGEPSPPSSAPDEPPSMPSPMASPLPKPSLDPIITNVPFEGTKEGIRKERNGQNKGAEVRKADEISNVAGSAQKSAQKPLIKKTSAHPQVLKKRSGKGTYSKRVVIEEREKIKELDTDEYLDDKDLKSGKARETLKKGDEPADIEDDETVDGDEEDIRDEVSLPKDKPPSRTPTPVVKKPPPPLIEGRKVKVKGYSPEEGIYRQDKGE